MQGQRSHVSQLLRSCPWSRQWHIPIATRIPPVAHHNHTSCPHLSLNFTTTTLCSLSVIVAFQESYKMESSGTCPLGVALFHSAWLPSGSSTLLCVSLDCSSPSLTVVPWRGRTIPFHRSHREGHPGCFQFRVITNKVAMNGEAQVFVRTYVVLSLR